MAKKLLLALALMITLVLALTLASCGDDNGGSGNNNGTSNEESSSASGDDSSTSDIGGATNSSNTTDNSSNPTDNSSSTSDIGGATNSSNTTDNSSNPTDNSSSPTDNSSSTTNSSNPTDTPDEPSTPAIPEGTAYVRVDEDTILFGNYPQTKVDNSDLISVLNSKAGELPTSENAQGWTDYGYYTAGNVQSYMWYIDLENGGKKYRGVYFTSYRNEDYTTDTTGDDSLQDDNGYTIENVYWFKYEPITWKILSESDGTAFIYCDMIIDSHEFDNANDGSIKNNFDESPIRSWLNDTFYNTAFNDLQKEIVLTTTNSSILSSSDNKVFLLSYGDASYSLSKKDYLKKVTDYALSQGAYVYSSGCGRWWLSTGYSHRYLGDICVYTVNGSDPTSYFYAHDTNIGVVPAVQITIQAAE